MTAHEDTDRLDRLELTLRVEPGDPLLAAIVASMGAGRALRHVITGTLPSSTPAPATWRTGEDPRWRERARRLLEGAPPGLRWVVPDDGEWPERLADLLHGQSLSRRGGPPLGLWLRGPLRLSDALPRSASVVGARSATTYGTEVAADLGAQLSARDVTVLSGAAFGIDSAAHRGALAMRGPTIAVLACGADVAYPRAHDSLLHHIADSGLVVSELPPGEHPTKQRFLARNRLIAAMSLGTVVVEAAVRSGALNTISWAESLGRVVMGVPGPVTSTASEGVHTMLREGRGLLVTGADDVCEAIAAMGMDLLTPERAAGRAFDLLDEDQQRVLEAVPATRNLGVAAIAAKAALPVGTVVALLRQLGEHDLVAEEGGEWRMRRT